MRNSGNALQYASKELKNDQDVVLAAVRNSGDALQYASKELKSDKDVVLEAVSKDGSALEYASEELKNDKEVVLAAVRQDGSALYYASDALKNDKEVVLAAVRNIGEALDYASAELMAEFAVPTLVEKLLAAEDREALMKAEIARLLSLASTEIIDVDTGETLQGAAKRARTAAAPSALRVLAEQQAGQDVVLRAVKKERGDAVRRAVDAEENMLCVACQEERRAIVLQPCFHMALCSKCAHNPSVQLCPMCRSPITARLGPVTLPC